MRSPGTRDAAGMADLRAKARARDVEEVPRGHLDAAIAEHQAIRRPLEVEPLEARVASLDAVLERDDVAWVVRRGRRQLARAYSAREAVARALDLRGAR